MSMNQSPIFGLTPHTSGIQIPVTANTAKDGTGTVATIFTAGANGSKIERVFLQHMGSNTATVVRFFVNNGATNATATNNYLIHEEALASWSNSETAASTSTIWVSNLILPAGYKLNAVVGTTVASGIMATGEGSDF